MSKHHGIMWQAPSRPPNRLPVIITGGLALVLAIGGHHWTSGLVVAATTVSIGFIPNTNWHGETKTAHLAWSLFLVAVTSCIFLVTFNRPGLGLHGWRPP